MESNELTIAVLREIRDSVREVRAGVEETNVRLDQTNVRLDRLERRQVESETRIATELIEVANAVRNVKELLERQAADRGKFDDHERRITALEARVES